MIAGGTRLTGTIVGRLAGQARQTASAAKAGRVVNDGGEPGVLDLTPLRDLLSELVAELRQLRLRDRTARAMILTGTLTGSTLGYTISIGRSDTRVAPSPGLTSPQLPCRKHGWRSSLACIFARTRPGQSGLASVSVKQTACAEKLYQSKLRFGFSRWK